MSLRRLTDRENALLYVCGLIEYIGRQTLNTRTLIVNTLGKELITHIYEYSDVYHCETLESVWYKLQKQYGIKIKMGKFDNVTQCKKAGYRVPSEFEIGTVFMRLINMLCDKQNKNPIDALFEVYNNEVCEDISYYVCSAYYSQVEEQYDRLTTGKWWD